jgi:hypothetical protein
MTHLAADRPWDSVRRQAVVFGMGTGRCGTHTLAELLNRQPDADFTHEQPPLLPWRRDAGRPGIRERILRLRRDRPRRFVGDVALFYLPYVEEAVAFESNVRFVCLERPREEVVASFCKWGDTVHPLPTDHWAAEPEPGWFHDARWTGIFPQYEGAGGREDRIRRYWDEYHERAVALARRFPDNIRIFPTKALNSEADVRSLLTFAGFPPGRQLLAPELKTAASEATRPHPRRVALRGAGVDDPRRCVVLVPYRGHIAPACEDGLRALERRGYVVWRGGGPSAIDEKRSQMATDALVHGFEETMWIDPDVRFDPGAVDRLRSHKVPIVAAIPPRNGGRAPSCQPLPGTSDLVFGEGGGLAEVLYAAGAFLLVRQRVYMDQVRQLRLPTCNEHLRRPLIPFFRPMVQPRDDGTWYLPEDFSFCEAARRCGHRVLADTSIRLWRLGEHASSWEEIGTPQKVHATVTLRLGASSPVARDAEETG